METKKNSDHDDVSIENLKISDSTISTIANSSNAVRNDKDKDIKEPKIRYLVLHAIYAYVTIMLIVLVHTIASAVDEEGLGLHVIHIDSIIYGLWRWQNFAIFVISNISFLWIQGSNPGYITISTEIPNEDIENHRDIILSSTSQDINDDIRDKTHSTNLRRNRIKGDIHHPVEGYCQQQGCEGNIRVIPRSYHCKTCRKCVATFDYHYSIIRTCVGERNHLRFYLFLLIQVFSLGWLMTFMSPFIDENDKYAQILQLNWMESIEKEPVILVLRLILKSIYWFLVSMTCFHSALIIVNIRTHDALSYFHASAGALDNSRSNRVSYNEGVLKNIRKFFIFDKNLFLDIYSWKPTLWHPVNVAPIR